MNNPSTYPELPLSLIRFLQNREASVAPLLALVALPLFASVGASIDYGRAAAARTEMQAAVDASALMMAKDAKVADGTQLAANARSYFDANFQNAEVSNIATTVATSSTSSGYTVTISATGSAGDEIHGAHGLFEPQSGCKFQLDIQYRRSRSAFCRSMRTSAEQPPGKAAPPSCSMVAAFTTIPTARRRSRSGDRRRSPRSRLELSAT